MRTFLAAVIRVALVCCIVALGLWAIRQELADIHRSLERLGKTADIDRDFAMRTFHYVKPHKPFEWVNKPNGTTLPFCVECADVLRQAGLHHDIGTFVENDRYNELLEIERQAKGR